MQSLGKPLCFTRRSWPWSIFMACISSIYNNILNITARLFNLNTDIRSHVIFGKAPLFYLLKIHVGYFTIHVSPTELCICRNSTAMHGPPVLIVLNELNLFLLYNIGTKEANSGKLKNSRKYCG